jgi:hypothetical protein
MEEILLQGRLKGYQRMRLIKLLDMMYTPQELADEIGFSRRQVYRVYLPVGCPHERDKLRRIWIHGKTFAQWYEETYPRVNLGPDEAFCLTCKRGVPTFGFELQNKNGLQYLVGDCMYCQRRIARIVNNDKS